VEIVWHMARNGRHAAPNTLAGIDLAIASGATRIEVDVRLLADGDAALVHDRLLSDDRAIGGMTCDETRAAGLSVLSDAVRRVATSAAVLQVDLKDELLLPVDKVAHLAELVAPLGERVVVGSMIDWNLRRLRAAAPDLRLGFDPLLYFHHWNDRPADVPFPLKRGGYDYWDDHPLALASILSLQEYIAVRLEGLHAMVPGVDEIMLHYPTLLRAVDDGVDVCELFHRRGTRVLAWTLDADIAGSQAAYERLCAVGIDVLVTNTPADW
jgi:glycerophosphoryl diester phosphodiesterase